MSDTNDFDVDPDVCVPVAPVWESLAQGLTVVAVVVAVACLVAVLFSQSWRESEWGERVVRKLPWIGGVAVFVAAIAGVVWAVLRCA